MKRLTLMRFFQTPEATIGGLFLNGKQMCFTLEDVYRKEKIYGETRIPAGLYKIKLQLQGAMSPKYAKQFPTIHKGMLWLQDVPNFTSVYIHIGNKDEDTKGCILVGKDVTDGILSKSTIAYKEIYPELADAALVNDLEIEIKDESWI